MKKSQWLKIAPKIIKAEMAKRGVDYAELTARLNGLEVPIKVHDLRGRVSRGTFSVALFIQCLKALEIKILALEDSYFEIKEEN